MESTKTLVDRAQAQKNKNINKAIINSIRAIYFHVIRKGVYTIRLKVWRSTEELADLNIDESTIDSDPSFYDNITIFWKENPSLWVGNERRTTYSRIFVFYVER